MEVFTLAKFRMERVNEEIKKVLSQCIQKDIKDPRITGIISVTRVETSPDFKNSKVYLSIFDKNSEETFTILEKAVGKMKKAISQNVKIRFVPEIDLKLDNSIEYSFYIDGILKKTNEKD